MDAAIKTFVPNNRFIGILILAPIATSLAFLALAAVFSAIHPALAMLFPTAKDGLDEAIMVLPVGMFIVGISPIFGGLQYLLFGGAALWLYLQNYPIRYWACTLVLLAINAAVSGVIIQFGDSEFGHLCLVFGSFFAPVWGLVFTLLYKRSVAREAPKTI
jgi:uncharacterized membrane protein YidH (DUF202 family)